MIDLPSISLVHLMQDNIFSRAVNRWERLSETMTGLEGKQVKRLIQQILYKKSAQKTGFKFENILKIFTNYLVRNLHPGILQKCAEGLKRSLNTLTFPQIKLPDKRVGKACF